MLRNVKQYLAETTDPNRLVGASECLLLLLMIVCLSGCERPPAADADDIIAYVRNGAAGARVRHLGPEAQPYVRDVFKAHGDWQKELAPVADLMAPDSLWTREDNAWRDPEIVSERLETIRKWRDESKHEQQLDRLVQTIQKVPPTFAAEASRIVSAAEKELVVSDPGRLTQVAAQYETLMNLVQEAQPEFAENGTGLSLQDDETTTAVHDAWDQLHQTLTDVTNEEQERDQSTMEWMLDDGKRLRDEALENKRNARRDLSDPQEILRATRKLDIDIHYYDKMIRQAEQQQLELAGSAASGE